MTKQEIDQMILCDSLYEIVYRKEESQERVWYISNIKAAGKECITGFCHDISKELTFRIDKIVSAKEYWTRIKDENVLAPKNGTYLMICRGDHHTITELYHLEKGERFYKYFEDDYSHMNGWFWVIPLAYHFIDETISENYMSFPISNKDLKKPLYSRIIPIIVFKDIESPEEWLSIIARGDTGVNFFLSNILSPLVKPSFPFPKDAIVDVLNITIFQEWDPFGK